MMYPMQGGGWSDTPTERWIVSQATDAEWHRAYHCEMPAEVAALGARARQFRECGDHIAAGALEKDAAAAIRMAQLDALIAAVAARLRLRRGLCGEWRLPL